MFSEALWRGEGSTPKFNIFRGALEARVQNPIFSEVPRRRVLEICNLGRRLGGGLRGAPPKFVILHVPLKLGNGYSMIILIQWFLLTRDVDSGRGRRHFEGEEAPLKQI